MRILANENIPGDTILALRQAGHDVVWVRTEAPGSSDDAVLSWTQAEGCILITFDKDFGELAFCRGAAAVHGIILFRMASQNPEYVTAHVLSAMRSRSDWEGHFSTVDETRIRMTLLPGTATSEKSP